MTATVKCPTHTLTLSLTPNMALLRPADVAPHLTLILKSLSGRS